MNNIWNIEESDYSEEYSLEEKIRFFLRYAILAPSAHNTQPWNWKVEDNILTVFRSEEYTLKVSDPTLRETFISLGAFIENFIIAAQHFNYEPLIESYAFYQSDNPIVKLKVEKTHDLNKSALFDAITQRHTNRGYYREESINEDIIDYIKSQSESQVGVYLITSEEARERIAKLVGKGTYIGLSMRSMKEELAELVATESEGRDTGMVVEAMTEEEIDVTPKEWVLNQLDPQKDAEYWESTFKSSPLHVIIGTKIDGPEAWLKAGRIMQRILLIGAHYGLTHCISAAPIEIPTLSPLLRKEIDNLYRPQILFRLGIPQTPDFTRKSGRRFQ